jgi:hypothetical protein
MVGLWIGADNEFCGPRLLATHITYKDNRKTRPLHDIDEIRPVSIHNLRSKTRQIRDMN